MVNNSYKTISLKSQEKASQFVSDEMYNRRLRTTTHEYEREVRGILVLFFNRLVALHAKSPSSSTWKNITISTNDDSQLSYEPILEEAINKATQSGILLPIKLSHNTACYAVPTIYAPIKNLNFNIEGSIDFSVDELAKSAMPPIMRKPKTKTDIQIELFNLPLQNPSVFISTPDLDKGRQFLFKHIKKVVEKRFSGKMIRLSEAENLILTDAIKDVLGKRSSIVFSDISRFNPNVMFEYGVALSMKKTIQPLFNNAFHKYDPTRIPDIFKGIRVIKYNSRTSKPSNFEDSIHKIIEQWQKRITSALVCPVKSKCPFDDITEEKMIGVFPTSNRRYTSEWKDNEQKIIENHLSTIKQYKIDTPLENTNPNLYRICTRCALIRRSSHLIIELNKNDAENALILGIAFGHEKTIIAICRGSEDNIPSCWHGNSTIMYTSTLELLKSLQQLFP